MKMRFLSPDHFSPSCLSSHFALAKILPQVYAFVPKARLKIIHTYFAIQSALDCVMFTEIDFVESCALLKARCFGKSYTILLAKIDRFALF